MLNFFISCISFIWVLKTISCRPLLPRLSDLRLLSKPTGGTMVDIIDGEGHGQMSLLDLPDLALDSILAKLSPVELCSMARVCSNLRDRGRSDHLWERHMKEKWGRVIGDTALREWQCNMPSNYSRSLSYGIKCKGFFGYLSSVWPLSLVASKLKSRSKHDGSLPFDDSIMAGYLYLENGEFWLAAQVYNRENGHGFMLSCYDAELRYNSATDTFQASYSPRGRHTVEENISWDRIRAPPVDTPPYVLRESDCLDNLEPGDHFEIQWRRNKEYPYGWWYGVVGHLDSCIRNDNWCQCCDNDMVMLEFNQYPVDSRWRRAIVNRKSHQEEGNEANGFYGGIRKLYDQKEIAIWKSIWPKNIMEQ